MAAKNHLILTGLAETTIIMPLTLTHLFPVRRPPNNISSIPILIHTFLDKEVKPALLWYCKCTQITVLDVITTSVFLWSKFVEKFDLQGMALHKITCQNS